MEPGPKSSDDGRRPAHLSVIGLGQIGGSLALALRSAGVVDTVAGYDADEGVLSRALELGIVGRAASSPADAVRGARLVVLATPVGVLGAAAREVAPGLDDGAIVMDVGSVKHVVMREIEDGLAGRAPFVGCHPVAGTERGGPDSARPDLFRGRPCVVCPGRSSGAAELSAVENIWRATGARPLLMDAGQHDRVLAATSHLPHVASFALARVLGSLSGDVAPLVADLAGSSLRDGTRVAASPPVLWRDVFRANRDELLPLVGALAARIEELRLLIQNGGGELEAFLAAARAWRASIPGIDPRTDRGSDT